MDKPITIYGAAATGSVPIEAALTLLDLPYDLVDGEGPDRYDITGPVNPLRQIPTLVLPGGEVMTESAAMLIWLADRYPEGRLAPAPLHRRRAAYLRWMMFVSSAIYALAWVRNDPLRLVSDPAQAPLVLRRIAERRSQCWRAMDDQINPGQYILGDELSVLDLYVTVVSRWSPRRAAFYAAAPRMAEIVRRVDAEPRLADFWAERFAFTEGWED
ncbi:MAG TPA: glutathione S-transferase family protein [Caulobacteraceae bacterium]